MTSFAASLGRPLRRSDSHGSLARLRRMWNSRRPGVHRPERPLFWCAWKLECFALPQLTMRDAVAGSRAIESDIGKAYRDYYTHQDILMRNRAKSSHGVVRKMRQAVKRAYIADRLHYSDRQIAGREKMLSLLAYPDPEYAAPTLTFP